MNRNLIMAFALSALVMFTWEYFVAEPQMKAEQARQAQLQKQRKEQPKLQEPTSAPVTAAAPPVQLSRAEALNRAGVRVPIRTSKVDGSILLKGARFDDLRLKGYHETVDPKSPEIDLLSPSGSEVPYFAEFGWTGAHIPLPNDQTPWRLESGTVLSPGNPITLSWDNGQGLVFTRTISVDDRYMFTVVDRVTNTATNKAEIFPYALVVRDGEPKHPVSSYLHEGFIGVADDHLKDPTYDDFKKEGTPPQHFSSTGGWLGVTDKYWMAAVIPPQNEQYHGAYLATPYGSSKSYQANYSLPVRVLAPGASVSVTQRLFAGAKVVDTLKSYQRDLGINMFDYAVDWGWFFYFTRPLFWLLDKFNQFFGNFGLAILLATVVIRILLYPMMNASFKSMSRMKKLQPEMERLRKVHADDPQRQQQEMMDLYRREKINPLSGCLPMLVPLPIFISLYKVQYVTIEMYHAPFFGWIKDLSAPDPTSYLNLFGLLPFTIPATLPGFLAPAAFVLHVGIWPILMGITQWVQFKMNPAPTDPAQAKIFGWMPWIMTVMLAQFSAGLIIYYTWNNLLSMAQQGYMMKREGVPIHLFENLKPPRWLIGLLDKGSK